MSRGFLKIFLSNCAVHTFVIQKADDQTMRQTYDLHTGVAEALPDAILIGAVRFGDSDFTVTDSDDIVAAVRAGECKFLVLQQADNLPDFAVANLGLCGRLAGSHQKNR